MTYLFFDTEKKNREFYLRGADKQKKIQQMKEALEHLDEVEKHIRQGVA